jgi:iron(III) transport system ATP-binding protein
MANSILETHPRNLRDAGATGTLKLTGITKSFGVGGEAPAVDGIDLQIRSGEFLTLLGPSGCGKTTTLRMIAGFENPTTGELTLDGDDMTRLTPDKRPMAMVFQSYALFPHMSVYDNVAYGLKLLKMNKKQIEQEVDFALTSMSLSAFADRSPNQLSGGQQQRVALARAMVMKPKVLLFDEPLSNLDAKLRVQMRTEIRRLQQKLGITSVYVTHDQDEAMSLSDRIVVMRHGRIEQIATPEIVYRRPASVFVADFIGQANFLDVSGFTLHGTGETATANVSVLGADHQVPAHSDIISGSPTVLLVRPESVSVRRLPVESREVRASTGRILSSVFYGAWIEYDIETESGNMTAMVYDPAPGDLMTAGTFVSVGFEPERAWLMPAEDAR